MTQQDAIARARVINADRDPYVELTWTIAHVAQNADGSWWGFRCAPYIIHDRWECSDALAVRLSPSFLEWKTSSTTVTLTPSTGD